MQGANSPLASFQICTRQCKRFFQYNTWSGTGAGLLAILSNVSAAIRLKKDGRLISFKWTGGDFASKNTTRFLTAHKPKRLKYSDNAGNSTATKNQIVNNLWITGTIGIMRVKSSKQNCLECARKERVGIVDRKAVWPYKSRLHGYFYV